MEKQNNDDANDKKMNDSLRKFLDHLLEIPTEKDKDQNKQSEKERKQDIKQSNLDNKSDNNNKIQNYPFSNNVINNNMSSKINDDKKDFENLRETGEPFNEEISKARSILSLKRKRLENNVKNENKKKIADLIEKKNKLREENEQKISKLREENEQKISKLREEKEAKLKTIDEEIKIIEENEKTQLEDIKKQIEDKAMDFIAELKEETALNQIILNMKKNQK